MHRTEHISRPVHTESPPPDPNKSDPSLGDEKSKLPTDTSDEQGD